MISHAQLLILAAYGVLSLLLVGLGGLFRSLCRAPVRDGADVLLSVWLGWAVVLLGLQVWHFFLPVDARAQAACGAAAAVGLLLGLRSLGRVLLRGLRRNPHVYVAVLLVTLWLSNRALGGPRFGDVGLYHIPVVRWLIAYPIVPGLGNLYVPFGHGQSYFLWVALLDCGPFARRPWHLANGMLFLALLARGLLGGARLLRSGRVGDAADLFYLLFLPATVLMAISIYFTSPFSDPAVFALGAMLSGELIAFLVRPRNGHDTFGLLAITLLAVAATTVKLSIAGLAGTVVLVAVAAWFYRVRPGWAAATRTFLQLIVIGVCGVGPWIIRNIILTGCPFFPSMFGALPVEWRVGVDMIEWIQRPMLMVPIKLMFQDPHWYAQRLNSLGWVEWDVFEPLGIAAVAIVVGVGVRLWRWRRGATAPLSAVIVLPTLASFVFCFMNAPMPRYFGATLWLMPVQASLLGFAGTILDARRWVRLLVCATVVLFACLPFYTGEAWWLDFNDFEIVSRTPVKEVKLPTGLVVRVPEQNQTCWDAPPPCTPEPNPGLRLRREGDLGSGFVIDRSVPGAVEAKSG